jgi:hypothetical protein
MAEKMEKILAGSKVLQSSVSERQKKIGSVYFSPASSTDL